jgi:hypothetical protein
VNFGVVELRTEPPRFWLVRLASNLGPAHRMGMHRDNRDDSLGKLFAAIIYSRPIRQREAQLRKLRKAAGFYLRGYSEYLVRFSS